MNKPKYSVFGGDVYSLFDRDRHYISPHRVAELYGVNPSECEFFRGSDDLRLIGKKDFGIILQPRSDGNYTLPKESK